MKIVYDLYPARAVVIPSSTEISNFSGISFNDARYLQNARKVGPIRIVITDEVIMIAADSHNGPMLIFQEKYDKSSLVLNKKATKSSERESRLKTVSGKSVIFGKDDDCGCGSKLRAWNPYRTMYSIKDPTE